MNKFRQWLQKFMTGRYGSDKLNMVILGTGVILALISLFIPAPANLALTIVYYGLTVWALFRCFSRETYKRFEENRKFLLFQCPLVTYDVVDTHDIPGAVKY